MVLVDHNSPPVLEEALHQEPLMQMWDNSGHLGNNNNSSSNRMLHRASHREEECKIGVHFEELKHPEEDGKIIVAVLAEEPNKIPEDLGQEDLHNQISELIMPHGTSKIKLPQDTIIIPDQILVTTTPSIIPLLHDIKTRASTLLIT